MTNNSIAILAYGSLINDPGLEIGPLIIERIQCQTPFRVEYARSSRTRNNAPTLIPVIVGGTSVQATLLVLDNSISKKLAEDMLWRRETRQKDLSKVYKKRERFGVDDVEIITRVDLQGINEVLYTRIGQNIDVLNGNTLAKLAIESILNEAGERKEDGVRYLANAMTNGIFTPLTTEYEKLILIYSSTQNLSEAITVLDKQRFDAKKSTEQL